MSDVHIIKVDSKENDDLLLEKEILAPFQHICQVKGKQLRIKIITAFNHWLQVSKDIEKKILGVVNSFHVASLLFDDIQDDSTLRRGMPAAHCIYGVPLTINTGLHAWNLVLKAAFDMDVKISKVVLDTYLEMCRGQGQDIYWRDNLICPTEQQYYEMLEKKTGQFFLMGVQMLQVYSNNKEDYSKLVLLLGRYFQIRDDYCNLSQQEALEEWPGVEDLQVCKENSFCEDITEGKISLPIIHALQQTKKGGTVLNIIRQKTRDVQLKKYCVSLLEEIGSLQYTRDVLAKLDLQARAEVARLGGNPLLDKVLDELLSWKGN